MEFPNRVHNRIAIKLVPTAALELIDAVNREMDSVACGSTHRYLGGHDCAFGDYIRNKYGIIGWQVFIAHLIADEYSTNVLNPDNIVDSLSERFNAILNGSSQPPYYVRED